MSMISAGRCEAHAEGQACVHAAGVVLHRLVQVLADLGELDDVVEALLDLLYAHAQDGAAERDVVAARELGWKPAPTCSSGATRPRTVA